MTSRIFCQAIDSNGNKVWTFLSENPDDWGIVKAFATKSYIVYKINRHLHFLEPETGQLVSKV